MVGIFLLLCGGSSAYCQTQKDILTQKFQGVWSKAFHAIKNLGLDVDQVFSENMELRVETIEVIPLEVLNKPEGATRFSAFYNRELPQVYFTPESQEIDEAFEILTFHEGSSTLGIGDRGNYLSTMVSLAKDSVFEPYKFNIDVPDEVLRESMRMVLSSEIIQVRSQNSTPFLWDPNEANQYLSIPNDNVSSKTQGGGGTIIGGGGDSLSGLLLKMSVRARLQVITELLGGHEALLRLYGSQAGVANMLSQVIMDHSFRIGFERLKCHSNKVIFQTEMKNGFRSYTFSLIYFPPGIHPEKIIEVYKHFLMTLLTKGRVSEAESSIEGGLFFPSKDSMLDYLEEKDCDVSSI